MIQQCIYLHSANIFEMPHLKCICKATRHIFVRVLNGFEGSACDKTGTVCQPARSRGTPSTERATCLGPGDVGGSTKRCRHLRLDKSHWQTICHGVTAPITDQKHQWKCKGHSMTAMEIPLWTCNDVLTCLQVYCNYFPLHGVKYETWYQQVHCFFVQAPAC